ncbi:CG15199, partial [Drosophila busckii]
ALTDHCYYEELGLSVPLNDFVYPVNQTDFCANVYCREDYVLMIKHCDRMQLAHGCYFTDNNYTLPYPQCCAQLVCENA